MPSFTPLSYSTDYIESQSSQHASSQNSYGPFNVKRRVGDLLKSQYYSDHPGFSSRHGWVSSQIYSNNEVLERQYHSDHSRPQTTYASSQNNHKDNDIESQHSRNDAQNSQPQSSDFYKGDNNSDQNKKMWQCLPIASSEDLESGKLACYFWNQEDVEICRNCGEGKVKQGRSWLEVLKRMFGSRC